MPGTECGDHSCREEFIKKIESLKAANQAKLDKKDFWLNLGKIIAIVIVCVGIAVPIWYSIVSKASERQDRRTEKIENIQVEVLIAQKSLEKDTENIGKKIDRVIKIVEDLWIFQKNIPEGDIAIRSNGD